MCACWNILSLYWQLPYGWTSDSAGLDVMLSGVQIIVLVLAVPVLVHVSQTCEWRGCCVTMVPLF